MLAGDNRLVGGSSPPSPTMKSFGLLLVSGKSLFRPSSFRRNIRLHLRDFYRWLGGGAVSNGLEFRRDNSYSVVECVLPNLPVSHHPGGVPQQRAHRSPTVFAYDFHQRFLRLVPLWLSVLD
jgi:hypothetical protein